MIKKFFFLMKGFIFVSFFFLYIYEFGLYYFVVNCDEFVKGLFNQLFLYIVLYQVVGQRERVK